MRYFWDYCVSTHSRLKAAAVWIAQYYPIVMFQHTAARRRLDFHAFFLVRIKRFQHTAARRRLAGLTALLHSATRFQHTAARRRLGHAQTAKPADDGGFNTQPPEGGWNANRRYSIRCNVSTHSRPKAAGRFGTNQRAGQEVSTHSRPKAAGAWSHIRQKLVMVSTHSRPKAAGLAHIALRFG